MYTDTCEMEFLKSLLPGHIFSAPVFFQQQVPVKLLGDSNGQENSLRFSHLLLALIMLQHIYLSCISHEISPDFFFLIFLLSINDQLIINLSFPLKPFSVLATSQ